MRFNHSIRALLCASLGGLAYPALATVYPIDTMFEAEASPVNAPWVLKSVATAAGQAYVSAGDGPAELSYDIDVPFAGEYKIWLRVLAPSTSSDSVFLSTGGGTPSPQDAIYVSKTSDGWQWFATTRRLPAGRQTIKLRAREAGLGVDRILITALPAFMPTGLGDNPHPPPVVPPAGHPRLFAREADLEKIRSQLTSAELVPVLDRLNRAAASYSSGSLPAPTGGASTNFDEARLIAIQAKALSYLLYGNQLNGEQAVTMMSDYLRTAQFPTYDALSNGSTILTSAMVYDWCYALMTSDQRKYFVHNFLILAPKMEINFPLGKQGSVTGHGSEKQLMRDQLAAAIAFYDEAPAIYQVVAGRFFSEYVEPRNFSYQAQAHHQGVSYGPVRYIGDMFAAWIFRRMGAGDVFDPVQQKTPYHWIYMRRPDGQLMRDGDVYHSAYTKPGYYWAEPVPYLLSSSYYSDPILKREQLVQQRLVIAASDPASRDDIWNILFSDVGLGPQSPQSLPLTKYFGEPSGMMVARTDWIDKVDATSNIAVATMKIGAIQYTNHQHMDAGQFQFYYKGGLATASGIYYGAECTTPTPKPLDYGSAHDMNYQKRTIAHNGMLIFDPTETFLGYANDGGQRWVNSSEPFSQAELLGIAPADILPAVPINNYVVAQVLKHESGPDEVKPDYSYLKGDLTKAYSSKVSEVKRSFVFLNLKEPQHPAALIVFDKVVSTNDSFAKTWLLHSQSQPEISGDTVTIKRVDSNYNGKLVNRTLLPVGGNATITMIGGPGKEYLVNGVNYPICPSSQANTEEPGSWRVEVSPKTKAAADTFLNVMQVMDANGGPAPLPTLAISSDQFSGVQIRDRVVLFSKDSGELTSSASFTLAPSSQPAQVLVTDLTAGIWSVGQAGGPAVQYEVKPSAGTLYFTAPAGGTYLLQRGAVTQMP